MTCRDIFTATAHGLIAIALQMVQWLLFGWSLTVCAMFPLGLFYGRELSQEGRKAADRLMINHGDLWRYPREALACLWPGCWGPSNRLDFIVPAAAVGLVAITGL